LRRQAKSQDRAHSPDVHIGLDISWCATFPTTWGSGSNMAQSMDLLEDQTTMNV
jgi:hypothetical protein